ncbi:bifunctional 2-C-methyl-D-erythritol 4-phosphate cytidylyltransferase/2-C-methyl-D-erythritol 2,4-cyclodiphosphate synthase [Kordiimonas sp.]|uniref:bifunctional 2-C-methyl-D-erythritol 4-phosphate cytidylyltransferase/2-C-methyl-D-erythritol 2,4-cyclodiphosphate synthase n=1 Tax=Kordiimonas sp. TaxID=1970157 RepID=UPI003A8FA5B9
MPEVMTKSQTQISQPRPPKIAVLIVAAGSGSRAGGSLPKQYRSLCGEMLLTHTLRAMIDACPDALIQVVINPDNADLYARASDCYSVLPAISGGRTRQESVLNGLRALESQHPDYVLVHDAARPFVDTELVLRVLAALKEGDLAVVPGMPVVDTLKYVENDLIQHTVDRSKLFAVQTPQGFRFKALLNAHERTRGQELTDDAAVIESDGVTVRLLEGSERNFKLTTGSDFSKAENMMMMAQGDIRTGIGYDVHRFEEGDGVWLCGVRVPFTKRLKGHSDADVGLHALTDAILAAIADGDIGQHFPPNDNRWRGVSSDVFLAFARDRVHAKRGAIGHVAVCLICEKPKIGPHRDAMRARIAELLDVDTSRVSVQATTTEKLGFTGREEGIAAQATATVRLPMGDC